MSGDLQYLSQTGNLLVIRNPIQLFTWMLLGLFVVPTLFLAFVQTQIASQARLQTSFVLRNLIPLLWAASVLILLATGVWSHTLTMSRSAGTATLEDRWLGIPYHSRALSLAEIDGATTESARGGSRVAIVLKGGEAVYPFGKGFNTKPSQYRAIQDINSFVGHGGSAISDTDQQERDAEEIIRQTNEGARPKPKQ